MRRRKLGSLITICVVAFGGLLATFLTDSSPELGLDLQGGASVVLQPPDGTPSESLDQAIEIIRSRVDALGVAEPDIVRQGDTVLVELPGVKDQQRALEIVGQTAELRFRPVLNLIPPEGEEPPETTTTTAASTTTTADPASTTTTVEGETTTTTATTAPTTTTTVPPTTDREDDLIDEQVVLPDRDGSVRYVLGPTTLVGSAVESASADFDGVSQWAVGLVMTGDGIDGFNALSTECFNSGPTCPTQLLAITLDGEVVSAPQIQNPTFERGDIQITGSFSEGEAKDLALVLRYGSLPVELEQQDAQTVSATLGEDSLRAGLIAGAVGTALVLLYMFFYYRILGIVVAASLVVWAALQWSIISWLGETQGLALSLAGVTGIIVSIGVTVDSFVVLFERMKDEVRNGATGRTAADRGFRHAFRTTIIADTSAMIGAATLYLLTVGPVRGFAFFLGLSTVLDVVVFYLFTRPFVALLARRKGFSTSSFIGARSTAPVTVGGGS